MTMVKGLKTGLVALLAVGALLAGPMAGGEALAGKKSGIKARIADKKFKVNRKPGSAGAGGAYVPTTGIINIVGSSAKLSGSGLNTTVELKVLSLTTQVGDLATAGYPLTVPVELATFSRIVNRGGTPVSEEIWAGAGVTLTISSYKGGRIKARFEGTIPAEVGAAADAVVEGGKLSVLLNAPAS
jgi:hypothetical protein